jgi:hypothetical protein
MCMYAICNDNSAVDPPAPHVISVKRQCVLFFIRNMRACKFFTPSSVRGGKYSNDTCVRGDLDAGSVFSKSMILGSGGTTASPLLEEDDDMVLIVADE